MCYVVLNFNEFNIQFVPFNIKMVDYQTLLNTLCQIHLYIALYSINKMLINVHNM